MLVSLQNARCISSLTSSSSSSPSSSSSSSSSSNRQFRAVSLRISCCAPSVSASQIKRPDITETDYEPASAPATGGGSGGGGGGSGIRVPRQSYLSVSKLGLLDAIIHNMFTSEEEAQQFRHLAECLDSILHAEHKSILEDMRADYDLTRSTKSKGLNITGFPAQEKKIAANLNGNGNVTDTSPKPESIEKEQEDESDSAMQTSSDFALNLRRLVASSLKNMQRNPIADSRDVIPVRFQRSFMKLLYNAEFEELSQRDLMLTSALNTDYLLTLPIYVDWKKASESQAIIFRRGYATERQKGLLIGEKLDYLQSKLLQSFFSLIAKPLGRFGVWLKELYENMSQQEDIEVLANKIRIWLEEFPISLQPNSNNAQIFEDFKRVDVLSDDLPIWVAAQKAVTRYEGILSEVGPRERLLRKFLILIGLVPSTPKQAFDLDSDITGSESHLSPSFLSRISLSDIWRPASPQSCENNFQKMLKTSFSVLFSESTLQEPAFQELILLYMENAGEKESDDDTEVLSSLRMKIYERIPIPDLPVVFPHKKLSFRILDTVRLDAATILGLLAYFLSYKFENILSSPSALVLDVVATSALVLYVTRVLLGYKQTIDRYQLLVNKTLYEKTVASGFGCIHFLVDASEQQQFKEAILVYAILLKSEKGQVGSTRSIGDKCERFIYNVLGEKVEMPVDKAIETLSRLGLVTDDDNWHAIPCSRACRILQKRWNNLINIKD